MKVVYHLQAGEHMELLVAEGVIPFCPHAGMLIAIGPDADYLEVSIVHWSAEKPDAVDVWFVDSVEFRVDYYVRQGWRMWQTGHAEAGGLREQTSRSADVPRVAA